MAGFKDYFERIGAIGCRGKVTVNLNQDPMANINNGDIVTVKWDGVPWQEFELIHACPADNVAKLNRHGLNLTMKLSDLTFKQKGNKMNITEQLKNAKIGDVFTCAGGFKNTVELVGSNIVVESEGRYWLYDSNGHQSDNDTARLLPNPGPRKWLDDMPSADLFNSITIGIEYDKKELRWKRRISPGSASGYMCMTGIKMPHLTHEQLKNDNLTVTLEELREYQANK